VARGEALAGSAHHHQSDAVDLARDFIDVRAQLDEHLHVQGVQLVGPIERKGSQSIQVMAQYKFGHRSSSERSRQKRKLFRDTFSAAMLSPIDSSETSRPVVFPEMRR
jgi:hypothetical protein